MLLLSKTELHSVIVTGRNTFQSYLLSSKILR